MTMQTTPTRGLRGAEGFTLVELLVTLLLMTVLLALAAGALRHYWWVQSLEGGQDSIVTDLRGLQQRVTSETFPVVYGARFTAGSSFWENVRYDPVANSCSVVREADLDGGEFSGGVVVESAEFEDYITGGNDASDGCTSGLTGASVVFFFARGTATPGELTLVHSTLDRRKDVCVTGLTARVDEGACS
jgi:prepilin-type N-terminal cleavage/methylation domain-containing protein